MILNATVTAWIFIALGVISIVGAVLNRRIVSRSGKLFNLIIGDTVARVIYFIGGVFLCMVGISKLIGAKWF